MDVARLWARWWRSAARSVGAALLFASATVLVLQVSVIGPDRQSRSCGSSFDVIAGRSDWQTWHAEDVADPAHAGLVRTARCPDAVNRQTATAGSLATFGTGLMAFAIAVHSPAARPRQRRDARRQLRTLGNVAIATGAALSGGGLLALVVLVANPRATLFLYVTRPAVVLIGLIALQPGLFVLLLGLAIRGSSRTTANGDRR